MTEGERLGRLISEHKMSIRKFSKYIGIKTPQVLYDVINGRNGISKDLAEIIKAKCVNYSISWLISEEGNMLKQGKEYSISTDEQLAIPSDKKHIYNQCALCKEKDARIEELKGQVEFLRHIIESQCIGLPRSGPQSGTG